MRAYGLEPQSMNDVAESLGLTATFLSKPKYVLVTLRVKGDSYRRITPRGRRTGSVCLHGYTDFMHRLLNTYPQSYFHSTRYGSRIVTKENLWYQYDELWYKPESPYSLGAVYGELCKCKGRK